MGVLMKTTGRRNRPLGAILLALLVGFQALSGLFGGGVLVADPSGGLLRMPLSVLDHAPFADFLVPGLILLVILGIVPTIVAFALWLRPAWRAARRIERAFGEHWSWVGAGVVGVGLLIWLAVEAWLVGPSSLLIVYAGVGLLIVALALMPSTRRYYRA
jgi:hypothetical protein